MTGHAGKILLLAVVAILALLPAPASPADKPAAALKATVLVSARDIFSRGSAGVVEHLGLENFRRRDGFSVLDADDVLRGKRDKEPSPDFIEAQTALGKGLADYDNLDLARAVAELTLAAELFEKIPAEVETDPGRGYSKALTYLGAAQILSGELQSGQDAFRRLLVHDRREQLDKSVFPPSMARTFESVRNLVIDGPHGDVSFFSIPGQARVYIDGIFKCVTPCTQQNLPAGRHLVVVRKTGFDTWQGGALVEEGQNNELRCRLLDMPGGDELVHKLALFSSEIEKAKRLSPGLKNMLAKAGLQIVAIGRLTQSGQRVFIYLRLYSVDNGMLIGAQDGVFQPDSKDSDRTIDSFFSELIKNRSSVVESSPALAVDVGGDALRLKDEQRFEQSTPVYKTWWFWTSLGVGAATLATLLAVLLPRSSEPQSQILLLFGG